MINRDFFSFALAVGLILMGSPWEYLCPDSESGRREAIGSSTG